MRRSLREEAIRIIEEMELDNDADIRQRMEEDLELLREDVYDGCSEEGQ